ncbi:helix-turn-helix domain-containing protein [Lentilitoribacter sp. EG35]|uniref:helix-turn-helix domain-containing protein n=1 Tax=Lentilitoribacter sp. EG35 TaxID=3234192 RepID=UPI003460D38D
MIIDTSAMTTDCPYCKGKGEFDPTIGSRIRWLRNQTGQSQDQLASVIGMSRPALVNMEQGRQNITEQNIKLICKHFGVSADWLLGLQ